MIVSPVTGGHTKPVTTIKASSIISLYAPQVDVQRFFHTVPLVTLLECTDTRYKFYYPFTTAGDGPFYEALAKESLYYIPWKWEHEITDGYIKEQDTVVELGCATGDFLVEEIKRKNINAFGTELNESAKKIAQSRGIQFMPTTGADVTCAFQVLEHIHDIHGFITDAVVATKPGGYIIFGIPNNDCFIKDDPTCYLNMPPHHMGMWTEQSLRNLAQYFPLDVVEIKTECLQPHHYRYYYQVRFGDTWKRFGLLGKIFNKLVYELFAKFIIKARAPFIVGHTIMVVYKKRVV